MCEAAGILYQVIAHPTGKNNVSHPVLPEDIQQSWNDLNAKRLSCAHSTASDWVCLAGNFARADSRSEQV